MNYHARLLSVVLLILSLAGGCASLPPKHGDAIGTLRVSGPNVWLNNAAGKDGDAVRLGSSLATGPASSAMVVFRDGGLLQLDENTDPIFDWVDQAKCILVRIFKGQAYLSKGRACVEGPNINLVLNSSANILIKPQTKLAEVTLLQGSADVSVPAQKRLLPGQQLTVTGKRIKSVRSLSAAELGSVVAWRKQYRFKPLPAPEPERESPWMIRVPKDQQQKKSTQPPKSSDPATPPPGTKTPPPGTKTAPPAGIYSPLKYRDTVVPPKEPVIR